jgi:hypothetical protein
MGRKQWFGILLPLLTWGGTAALMIQDWRRDPYNPALGRASYGHNQAGALEGGLLYTAVEVAVLYVLLRPWSYNRSWRRAALALLLFTPWTGLHVMAVTHAGRVWATHTMWLLAMWLGLAILVLVSGLSAYLSWRYARELVQLPVNPRMQPTGRGGPALRAGAALPVARQRKR